jgi:hypothetical protein
MPELCNSQLVESLAAALETMAFVSLAPVEEPPAAPTDAVLIRVDFRGARKGRVELVTSRDLGRLLLDNTVGCDPSDTLVMPNPNDPLVELVNITCGMLLNRDQASGSMFEMSVPKVTPFDAKMRWESFIAQGNVDVINAEGSVLAIRMTQE